VKLVKALKLLNIYIVHARWRTGTCPSPRRRRRAGSSGASVLPLNSLPDVNTRSMACRKPSLAWSNTMYRPWASVSGSSISFTIPNMDMEEACRKQGCFVHVAVRPIWRCCSVCWCVVCLVYWTDLHGSCNTHREHHSAQNFNRIDRVFIPSRYIFFLLLKS
jgi:hypothetical protein